LATFVLVNHFYLQSRRKFLIKVFFFYAGVSALRLTDDATSEADRDTLAPLPLPNSWGAGSVASSGVAGGATGGTPHIPYYPTGYAPMSYTYSSDPLGSAQMPSSTFTYGREGSVHSGSGKTHNDQILLLNLHAL